MEIAQKNLNQILPKRKTRGLIDGLGTVIKDITGNLDNQDLKDIQHALNILDQSQNDLQINNNKQLIINEQLITRMNDLKNTIDANLKEINKVILRTTGKLNEFEAFFMWKQQLYRLEYTINFLNDHLEDLLNTITFSKNRIITRHLLNTEEMKYINDKLLKDNVIIPYESAILNLLQLKGLITKEKELIFIILIPQFNKEHFNLYQIIPIPIQNKTIFPIPPNFIILNERKYKYSTMSQCTKIYDVYYCQQGELQDVQNTCTPAIIALQKAQCNYTKTTWNTKIIPLTEDTIFVEPGSSTIEISSNCTRSSNKIATPSILSFSECYVNIDGKTFSSIHPPTFHEILKTLPWNDVQTQHLFPELTLHDTHNWTIQNIQELHAKHEGFHLHTTISYTTTGILSFLIVSAFILLCRKRLQPCQVFQFPRSSRNRKSHLRPEELHSRQPPNPNNEEKPNTNDTIL